ncbi:MAG: hypothetical protein U0T02_10455 [Solirubrobacteraceae bacterium]
MALDGTRTLRGALAGAAAAATWAALQPLDKRAFGSRYDDVELMGKAVTRGGAWPVAGLAIHMGNGALFGAIYSNVAPLLPVPPVARGPLVALAEHVALWPAGRLSDALHPARDELPALSGNHRAWWQSAWRHALFGFVLGELERRLNEEPEPELPGFEAPYSSNGHGSLEHAVPAEPTA